MASNGHDIGAVADFPEGVPRRVCVNGTALVVVRKGGECFALRDSCPHLGASLAGGRVGGTPLPCRPGEEAEYGREGEILRCPWHGWAFDLRNGRNLVRPNRTRVRSYSVFIAGDRVVIDEGSL